MIPEGQRVVEFGTGAGYFLDAVNPSHGVGYDISPTMVELASERFPEYEFRESSIVDAEPDEEPYDYVLLVQVIGEIVDLVPAFRNIKRFCHSRTRLVIVSFNVLWERILDIGGKLGWKTDAPIQNWFSRSELDDILEVSGFETCIFKRRLLAPLKMFGLGALINRGFSWMPLLNKLPLHHIHVCRPVMDQPPADEQTVSVVVPCKDEEGNVPKITPRVPDMGAGTEIIYVDDQSTDGTREKIEQEMASDTEHDIKMTTGPGVNKGAAVRAGFEEASGDIYMILDADMTVMPEDLSVFFDAIVEGKGEYVNGTRLVYPMRDESMRFLNRLGNNAFAWLFTWLLDTHITDTLCGTKVLWADDYDKVINAREYFGEVDEWGDYDWIFGAAKAGLKFVEVPVHYVERTAGQTKMTNRFGNGLVMLRMCWEAFKKLRTR